MKAKIYIGAKKYALYIGRKIVEKTLEFLTLPAKFVSNKVQDMKNLTMWGNSQQDGTPTPTAPIEVESVGDKTKNLFNENDEGIVYGRNISASGTESSSSISSSTYYIKVKPNTDYTIEFISLFSGSVTRYHLYDTNKTWLQQVKTNTSGASGSIETVKFTTTSDTQYLRFTMRGTSASQIKDGKIQLEEGNTATSYEPYGYKVPVEVRGKNLFDKNSVNIPKGWYDATTLQVGQPLPATPPSLSSNYRTSDIIKVTPNETYYMVGIGGGNPSVLFLDKDLNFLEGFRNSNETKRLITVPNNVNIRYMRVPFATATQDTAQLELGTRATSYQPYVEPVTTDIYLNEPLRKVGEYSDTLTVEGTNVTVVRNVEVIDETGTKTIEESLIHKVPSTTETYTIDIPIELQEGTLTIDTNTVIKPSKIEITGDIDNE